MKIPLHFNPLPGNKIITLSKFKAFEDNNFLEAQMVQFLFERVENIVEKDNNARYQHSFLFPTIFLKGFYHRGVKSQHQVVKG